MLEDLEFGPGPRADHYEAILADLPHIDFFEALTENYLLSRLPIQTGPGARNVTKVTHEAVMKPDLKRSA